MPNSARLAAQNSLSYTIIPARLASTRLPGKLLLAETGKPLILHTVAAASRACKPSGLCVATDSHKIVDVVRSEGIEAILTDPRLASGTDRVAAVAADMPQARIIVNVQGDEPEISGAAIDQAITLLEENPEAVMATLAAPIRDRRLIDDPACVKVVMDRAGRALYFSRTAIPHAGHGPDRLAGDLSCFHQHIGLYAYRREFLLAMAAMPRSPLEQVENLEQLRVLEAGHRIMVGIVPEATAGIDTAEDYRTFVERYRRAAA